MKLVRLFVTVACLFVFNREFLTSCTVIQETNFSRLAVTIDNRRGEIHIGVQLIYLF